MIARRLLCPLLVAATTALSGCAWPTHGPGEPASVSLPLRHGWFDGEPVFYITTDVSDATVARAQGANHAPRLADSLPTAAQASAGARRSAVDKVYAVENFEQGSVFASAPTPLGPTSSSSAYSPLWQMVRVTWRSPRSARTLRSEDAVLDAAERGLVTLTVTPVILNCPILGRGALDRLPGVSLGR